MSPTDIKRDMTSETMDNFLIMLAIDFNAEQFHATSLTLATRCRADNLYRTGKSFIGPAGWVKSVMTRLYETCGLLLIQSKIPYLYDDAIY